jgi:chaperone modulatory protein CbpM
MSHGETPDLTGVLLDERILLDLEEMCRACEAEPELLVAMVEEGLLEVRGTAPQSWRFPAVDVRRARLACRLHRHLDLNLPGVALALELLEELQMLRARVRALEQRGWEAGR